MKQDYLKRLLSSVELACRLAIPSSCHTPEISSIPVDDEVRAFMSAMKALNIFEKQVIAVCDMEAVTMIAAIKAIFAADYFTTVVDDSEEPSIVSKLAACYTVDDVTESITR